MVFPTENRNYKLVFSDKQSFTRNDLYERLSDDELVNRDRTYALTHSSRKILQRVGIWSQLIDNLVPFEFLHVIDLELNQKEYTMLSDFVQYYLVLPFLRYAQSHCTKQ